MSPVSGSFLLPFCLLISVGKVLLMNGCVTSLPHSHRPTPIRAIDLDSLRMENRSFFVGVGVGTAESDSLAMLDARLWALGDLAKSIRTGVREKIVIVRESVTSSRAKKDALLIEQDLLEATALAFPPGLSPRLVGRWTDDAGYHHAAIVVAIRKLEYLRYYFSLLPLKQPDEILSRLQALFKE